MTLAFAGAEGFGAETVGGRGGQILTVTNLDDSGPGSLRWALEDVAGPRTVVFAVNGTINLSTQIEITDPFVTVAGQTAAADGIVITGAKIRVKTSEVIIRGVTIHAGDGPGETPANRDSLYIGTLDYNLNNIIIDHSSIGRAIDENLSINGNATNITLSNNIIAEGLSHSIHPDGEHSKGTLISNGGSLDPALASRISIIKNLYAHNTTRNPEIRAGQQIEVINNWMYNYGQSHYVLAVGGANSGTLDTTVNAIGNYFQPGPDTPNYRQPIALVKMGAGSAVYLEDNYWAKITADAAGNQEQIKIAWNNGGLAYLRNSPGFSGSQTTQILDSIDVPGYVAANAGARPFARGEVDAYIVNGALNGGGSIIDSVAEAGGEPNQVPVKAAADGDGDGMPDWFEGLFGFDAWVFDANGDADADGFTNVEEYINGLYTGFDLPIVKTLVVTFAIDGQADSTVLPGDDTVAVVDGFNPEEGDRVDLSALLTGYDPLTMSLSDFVEITGSAGDTIISVDRDGAGEAYRFQIVAALQGVHGYDGRYDLLTNRHELFVRPGESLEADDTGNEIVVLGGQGPTPAEPIQVLAGDGDDRITMRGSAVSGSIDGGAGVDRLIVMTASMANLTNLSLIDVETLQTNGFTITLTAEMLAGLTSIGRSPLQPGGAISLIISGDQATLAASVVEGQRVILTATAGNDEIRTSSGGDNIILGDGDDFADGGDGDDILDGGAGNDVLYGGEGRDMLLGGAGDDILYGGGGLLNNTLRGGAGADTYYIDNAQDGVNERFGQTVDDGAIDVIITPYDRSLTQFVDNLILTGTLNSKGIGNILDNVITGNSGDNALSGGLGADTLIGGLGADVLDGGEGSDTASYATSATEVHIDLTAGTGSGGEAEGDVLIAIENVIGSAFADVLTGNAADNTLSGGLGADILSGRGGADVIDGGEGSDTASYAESMAEVSINLEAGTASSGEAEGDHLISIENLIGSAFADVLIGDAGDNTLSGGLGADILSGGSGSDTASYAASTSEVLINLVLGIGLLGDAHGDGFVSIENLIGSAHSDLLIGDLGNNVLSGGLGADVIDGGLGSDTASYATSTAKVTVDLSTGSVSGGEADGDLLMSIENVIGTAFDDVLTGDAGDNALSGGLGADILSGGLGADVLDGGDGSDTASYAASIVKVSIDLAAGTGSGGDSLIAIENLVGTAFADVLTGDAGDNVIEGGNGADIINGGEGTDTASYALSTAAVKVTISAPGAVSKPSGGAAQGDALTSIENVAGSNYNDTLTGNALANVIDGGAGNDIIDGSGGADRMTGGLGNDRFIVDDLGDVAIEGANGGLDVVVSGVSFTLGADIENLTLTGTAADAGGNDLANTLTGNDADNVLRGYDGKDTLFGGAGADTLHGGLMADKLEGGDGDDHVYGDEGDDLLKGGAGLDLLDGGAGADQLDGGAGDDQLYGGTEKDSLIGGDGNDLLDGGDHDDTLTAGAGHDSLFGGAGVDKLDGGTGDDQLYGGTEKDRLLGGDGNDLLDGGDHDDTLSGDAGDDTLFGGAGADKLDGGTGADHLEGGIGNDAYVVDHVDDVVVEADDISVDTVTSSVSFTLGAYVENLVLTGAQALSGAGNDLANILTGNAADNMLEGLAGNDTIKGGLGNDTVLGGVGADKLYGDGGDDVLQGDAGADLLQGGAGADLLFGGDSARDVFHFVALGDSTVAASDTIGDFDDQDVIDFATLDANATLEGNQAFAFIGTNAFSGAGQVRWIVDEAGRTVIQAEIDGVEGADVNVILNGPARTMNAGDFIL